jgi:hypothetical protein
MSVLGAVLGEHRRMIVKSQQGVVTVGQALVEYGWSSFPIVDINGKIIFSFTNDDC